MATVVHHFVDKSGRTHVDVFNSSIALDMGEMPREYHVCFNTQSNSRLIAELWKECDTGNSTKKLMIGCPQDGTPDVGFPDFEKAKIAVRRLCFDNSHPILGGLRAATVFDYNNARLVYIFTDMCKQIKNRVKETGKNNFGSIIKSTEEVYSSVNITEVINTISAHRLWKSLSWIYGMKPLMVLNLIGELVDPTWYVIPANPKLSGLFKERCGVYSFKSPAAELIPSHSIWLNLLSPFNMFFSGSKIDFSILNEPQYFFIRYGLRWMQKYRNDGAEAVQALYAAGWHHNVKLVNFIRLSWMASLYQNPSQEMDENSFFLGEIETADLAYRAAAS